MRRQIPLNITTLQFLVLCHPLLQSAWALPYSCDYSTDVCPFQFDRECDSNPDNNDGYCPQSTDCFDCDPCTQFDLNCHDCTQNGCVYCPSDAVCLSVPLPPSSIENNNRLVSTSRQYSSCQQDTDWVATCDSTTTTTTRNDNFFSDPLFSGQKWVFDLLNVQPAWEQGLTGSGVVIRVNDPQGVDVHHPELAANFDPTGSCSSYLPPTTNNTHGTAVASIAVGRANNGVCAVGVAPEATLTACLGPTELADASAAAALEDGLTTTHISINSWGFDACTLKLRDDYTDDDSNQRGDGTDDRWLQEQEQEQGDQKCPFIVKSAEVNPCQVCPDFTTAECEDYIVQYCAKYYVEEVAGCAEFLDLYMYCNYNSLSQVGQSSVGRGVEQGRHGKGIVYVFAAGNELGMFEDVNMEGWLNSRFTVTVGAVGKDGRHASYSTPGAALFLSGPGGDEESIHNHLAASPEGGCIDAEYGTSFAAPAVAGGIALMLQANPNLGWRDVQGILASTSQAIDSDDWTTNGAGLHHSNLYGFGTMDVAAAVEAAKTWVNYGPEKQVIGESGLLNLSIDDDGVSSTASTITITSQSSSGSFTIESVVVYLQLAHESRGDLEIILTSPLGTQSLLHPPHRPENQQLSVQERWELLTVRNYGEPLVANGNWTLTITDKRLGNLGNCSDLAFEYIFELDDGQVGLIDCDTISFVEVCANGSIISSEVEEYFDQGNTISAQDACCACGGGVPVSKLNKLVSWRVVVYGHDRTVLESEGPASGASDPKSIAGAAMFKVVMISLVLICFGFLL